MSATELERSHVPKMTTPEAGTDSKFSMKQQLSASMSIVPQSQDEYEQKLHNLGGEE